MRNLLYLADLNRAESILIFLSNTPATTQAMEVYHIMVKSFVGKVVNRKEVQI